MHYYLGADLGGTKTHQIIADETGQVVGFGESGPGNHQTVGYEGMFESLKTGLSIALDMAGITVGQISGAGFGIAGYDWPSEKPKMDATILKLGLKCPFYLVNDSVPGLVAGAEGGWGVGLVSGTGCNCRGWDKDHKREGRVTGYGVMMAEAAGSSELVNRAVQLVSHAWIKRIPPTALTDALVKFSGAKDVEEMLENHTEGRHYIGAEAARLVFQVAEDGDPTARELIRWAGVELGELANAVIRQLEFENLEFDVVLAGSMFEGGPMLTDPMRETILELAPGARFVRLTVPPVIGAVLIGMQEGGLRPDPAIRQTMIESYSRLREAQTE
jgi:N-acetylglucosamine kinase-like BadF-type ATPase